MFQICSHLLINIYFFICMCVYEHHPICKASLLFFPLVAIAWPQSYVLLCITKMLCSSFSTPYTQQTQTSHYDTQQSVVYMPPLHGFNNNKEHSGIPISEWSGRFDAPITGEMWDNLPLERIIHISGWY